MYMNHHGVAIEADELIFMQTAPLREDVWAEAIVSWHTFRSPPISLIQKSQHWFLFSFFQSTPVLDGGVIGVLIMTDSFHHYRRPGPRQTWGLFKS